MGILDRYVGKSVLIMIVVVVIFLTILTAIITFIDQTRYLGRGSIDFIFLLKYLAIQVPGMVVMIFPVAVLLGGVIALGNLAKTSELIILQTVGLSKAGVVFSALKMVFPLILVVILLGETAVPALSRYSENLYNQSANQGNVVVTYDGLWLREGNSFIAARYIMTDGSISGVVRYDFEGETLKQVTHAQTGVYDAKSEQWVMGEVSSTAFADGEVQSSFKDTENWHLNLNPERVEILGVKYYNLTITGLIDYITYLESNNQEADNYRLQLYMKFVSPFSMVVMLLLAASTVFGPLRTIPMGTRIVIGIALGFVFYVANSIGAPFSLVYGLPPIVGAALPTLLFFIFALWLLNKRA